MYIFILDISWVGVKDRNLPPSEVNVVLVGENIIGRARYGGAVIGGRIHCDQKDFLGCLDADRIRYICTYEVTISSLYQFFLYITQFLSIIFSPK